MKRPFARCLVSLILGCAVLSPLAADAAPQRLTNPFVGARWYVDPVWREDVLKEPGGQRVADTPTAIWMDHIGAIAPTAPEKWGLARYLDDAVQHKADLVTIVIYDLPNRDCAALASSGELLIAQNGFERYKQEYIKPIVEILSQPKYQSLRIIAVIEPDSLPNLVTNMSVPKCQEAAGPGGYVEATQFTLDALYPLRNVYSYLDIGHSGWLGWDSNLANTVELISKTIKGTAHGVDSVAGFVSNTANYTPLAEPFLDDVAMAGVPGNNSQQVRGAKFYQWNGNFGEIAYVRNFRQRMIEQGFPSRIGMLIDTSRNGWGGRDRPKAVSTATNADEFVDGSRIDRRVHRGMWCNQPGGLGERPRVNPTAGVDAYLWVKPPGTSDGVAKAGIVDPDDPAKRFDRFCDPTFTAPGTDQLTRALPDAPHAGRWFSAGFKVLLDNAYPSLK